MKHHLSSLIQFCVVVSAALLISACGGGEGESERNGEDGHGGGAPCASCHGGGTASGPQAQSITFTSPGDQQLGVSTPAVTATSSSGLTVSITSNTPAVCSVTTTALTLKSAGTCTLRATQAGNASWTAAADVTQSFNVAAAAGPVRVAQSITFASPGAQTIGSPTPALVVTATSGLAVTLASSTTSVCTVSGAILTLRVAGTCTLTASQLGDATFAGAPTVSNTFYVVAQGAAAGKLAYNLKKGNNLSCASCHGVPGSQPSSKILTAANRDVVLSTSIVNNIGGMGSLTGLYTQQEIVDISSYLATPGI